MVQRLLALVIAATDAHTACAAYGVNFVDEHDARRVLFGLFKHIAHAACAHTHEHFHKVRARDGEERHTRFTRNSTRQQGFTRTRRANKQRPFRNFATKAREFLRVSQEFNDLFQLFLGFVDAGHIVKRHAALLFGQQFRTAFAKAHRATAPAALHPVHEIDPHADQQDKGQPSGDDRHQTGLFLRISTHAHAFGQQTLCHLFASWADGDVMAAVFGGDFDLFAVKGNTLHLARVDLGYEVRIGNRLGRKAVCAVEKVEQGQHQDQQHHPECNIARVSHLKLLLTQRTRHRWAALTLKIEIHSAGSMR